MERGRETKCGGGGRLPVCRPEGLLPIDAGAQHGEFTIEERLIDPLEPLGWWFDGQRVAQMRESKARPGPVHGMLSQAGAARIAKDVAESCIVDPVRA